MIDYSTYRRLHRDAHAFRAAEQPKQPAVPFDPWPYDIDVNSTISEDDLMVLPPDVHGFHLKEKKWGS